VSDRQNFVGFKTSHLRCEVKTIAKIARFTIHENFDYLNISIKRWSKYSLVLQHAILTVVLFWVGYMGEEKII